MQDNFYQCIAIYSHFYSNFKLLPDSTKFKFTLLYSTLITAIYCPFYLNLLKALNIQYFVLLQECLVKKLVVVDVSPSKMPRQSQLIPDYMRAMKEALAMVPALGLVQGRAAINAHLSKSIPVRAFIQNRSRARSLSNTLFLSYRSFIFISHKTKPCK